MSTFRDFEEIPHAKYRIILADPPWNFKTRSESGQGRSPSQHYDCMSIEDIKRLPVAPLAARGGAILFMWVTDPHLRLGLEVMEAWGFTYKTVGFTWVKLNKSYQPTVTGHHKDGSPRTMDVYEPDDFFTGMGYYTRANPEMCLIGTSATRMPERLDKAVRQLIISRRREHSRKPDEVYQRITRLFAGPYIELFARTAAPGWDAWGNEVGKHSVNQVDNSSLIRHT